MDFLIPQNGNASPCRRLSNTETNVISNSVSQGVEAPQVSPRTRESWFWKSLMHLHLLNLILNIPGSNVSTTWEKGKCDREQHGHTGSGDFWPGSWGEEWEGGDSCCQLDSWWLRPRVGKWYKWNPSLTWSTPTYSLATNQVGNSLCYHISSLSS